MTQKARAHHEFTGGATPQAMAILAAAGALYGGRLILWAVRIAKKGGR